MSSGTKPADDVTRRVGYHLKQAQNALRTRMDTALRPLGITSPQYAVLAGIADEPGVSNAALARRAFVTPQTMQGVVANLEKAGLLSRSEHPTHGRILRAELTKAGGAVLRRAHGVVADVEQAMLTGMSAADKAKLALLLGACAENLGD